MTKVTVNPQRFLPPKARDFSSALLVYQWCQANLGSLLTADEHSRGQVRNGGCVGHVSHKLSFQVALVWTLVQLNRLDEAEAAGKVLSAAALAADDQLRLHYMRFRVALHRRNHDDGGRPGRGES